MAPDQIIGAQQKERHTAMDFEQNNQLINRLAEVAKVKSHINTELYSKYNVKRGLRKIGRAHV